MTNNSLDLPRGSNIPCCRFLELTKGDHGHEEDLDSVAKEHRQQHALAGRSEHVTMNQFPPKFFLCVLLKNNPTLIAVHTASYKEFTHPHLS